jgi:hypothetical protein
VSVNDNGKKKVIIAPARVVGVRSLFKPTTQIIKGRNVVKWFASFIVARTVPEVFFASWRDEPAFKSLSAAWPAGESLPVKMAAFNAAEWVRGHWCFGARSFSAPDVSIVMQPENPPLPLLTPDIVKDGDKVSVALTVSPPKIYLDAVLFCAPGTAISPLAVTEIVQ